MHSALWKKTRSILLGMAALFSGAQGAVAGPALLTEPATGLVLYAEDADLPWRPASLTKLMTAYLAFEAIRDGRLSPEDMLTSTALSRSQPPSKFGLPLGAQIKVDLGIKALIVKSANDVAVMLAEKIGGSNEAFVDQMNRTAKRLGMTNTKFVNPNGLPQFNPDGTETPDQAVTTARDMALLSNMILKEFPQYGHIFSMTEVRVGNRLLTSHNSILKRYDGADGMKTGFVCAAGYNVVASATRNGRQLVAVVLGERSSGARTIRAAALFEHGFEIYPWKAVLAPTLATWPVETLEGAQPADMRGIVCSGRKPAVSAKQKPKRPKSKPGHGASAAKPRAANAPGEKKKPAPKAAHPAPSSPAAARTNG
ncbi:D-alanyl-D-alanine carboxypeptidase [Rhodomicrobium sp. Az07]|uniref:D-alanyl-D-alanine carboxypeptidase family protein n=1 Tax=Rhodomicrobium sp. Az07 TaxID=2839034 RepID=UPI001BEC9C2A|nr:D-alanyl-D-alanine carboxypeptidase family protein [Rhodomicrobium sp. Az07]MBT3071459.1 D-alanyl-D-alanine carboxypeptidase [Rhodomicrobium sp. Az07]